MFWRLATLLFTLSLTLFGLVAITFVVGRCLPTDPVVAMVGDRASEELYQRTYLEMGLDKPIYRQFIIYARQMLRGDFGTSMITADPIASDIARYFPATLELSTLAMIIGLFSGILLAVISVLYPDKFPDHLARVAALASHSIPIYWLVLVALLIFYVNLGWVSGPGRADVVYSFSVDRVTGLFMVDSLLAENYDAFKNALSHAILPSILLGLVAMGFLARMIRGFLFHQIRQNYVKVLRLKGLSLRRVVLTHVLPNSLPEIMAVSAMTYAYLLEGAVLTETVFAWPGLGTYITNSLFAADVKAVLSSTLVIGAVYVTLNMLSEHMQKWFDPRNMKRT
jgi:peptide/nickel transport system permease protein